MPKETFYNLNSEKQERIRQALREEFESRPFDCVSVKDIVEKLGIARGSFYQYFESLEDAYFSVLARETSDVHYVFMDLLKKNNFDFEKSLIQYGDFLYDDLFKKENYNLYKYWYMSWNEEIERKYRNYSDKHRQKKDFRSMVGIDFDLVLFVRSVIHNVIYRNFYHGWDRDKFLKVYMKNVEWIAKGIEGPIKMGIIEVLFDLTYLILVLAFGLAMLIIDKKNSKIFGSMAVVLGLGDSFHLLPRVLSYLSPQGFAGHLASLSWGKMVTSITMTIFYVLYYFYYRRVSGDFDKWKKYYILFLAALRIGLSLLPQNGWGRAEESYAFGIYRNIPFALMGLFLLVWSYRKKNLPELRNMWFWISLSFIFYLPVVIFADRYPVLGALMMPKTLAYLLLVWTGLKVYMPNFGRENILAIGFSSLVMGLGFGAFYREFSKFYKFTGQGHLCKIHPHILILGFVFSLFLYLISKDYSADKIRELGKNIRLYLLGLLLTLLSMVAIGLWEVVSLSQGRIYLKAFQGLGGLGHIILAFAMVKLLLFISKNEIRGKSRPEAFYGQA